MCHVRQIWRRGRTIAVEKRPPDEDIGYIEFTVHYHPEYWYEERVTSRWVGGPFVYITTELLHEALDLSKPLAAGSRFNLHGVRLRVIKSSDTWPWDRYLVMRAGLAAWLYEAWYRYTRLFDLIYRRLILTAAVWNLAHYEREAVPSWQDLKCSDSVSRFFGWAAQLGNRLGWRRPVDGEG